MFIEWKIIIFVWRTDLTHVPVRFGPVLPGPARSGMSRPDLTPIDGLYLGTGKG